MGKPFIDTRHGRRRFSHLPIPRERGVGPQSGFSLDRQNRCFTIVWLLFSCKWGLVRRALWDQTLLSSVPCPYSTRIMETMRLRSRPENVLSQVVIRWRNGCLTVPWLLLSPWLYLLIVTLLHNHLFYYYIYISFSTWMGKSFIEIRAIIGGIYSFIFVFARPSQNCVFHRPVASFSLAKSVLLER